MHVEKQSSATMVSGFKNKTYLPLENLYPWLHALANPRFSLFPINRIQGKAGFK